MSDYSNYSVSDYDDLSSEEDNNAGAYGGYDDLYDDVIEEAGYDAWDIGGDPEFDFDEERYLFEFDPFSEYFELKDPSDIVTMTYQSLVQMSEITHQLIGAWKKRSSSVITPEDDSSKSSDQELFPKFGLNLYQLDPKEREELRSYSVWKVLRILGGEEPVCQFDEKVAQIVKYCRKVLLDILSSCLPPSLPYPVISTILSHLIQTKGLARIGQVIEDNPSNKVVELDYMDKLYLAMADVFDHLKIVMFNIEPNTLATEPSFNEKNESLCERFELLASIVTSAKLETGLGGLEIGAGDEAASTIGEDCKDG